jgi:hypothetical protein
MRRGIAPRHVAVFGFDQHVTLGVDENGRERMIAVRHRAAGDREAAAQELCVALAWVARAPFVSRLVCWHRRDP